MGIKKNFYLAHRWLTNPLSINDCLGRNTCPRVITFACNLQSDERAVEKYRKNERVPINLRPQHGVGVSIHHVTWYLNAKRCTTEQECPVQRFLKRRVQM